MSGRPAQAMPTDVVTGWSTARVSLASSYRGELEVLETHVGTGMVQPSHVRNADSSNAPVLGLLLKSGSRPRLIAS
jgi:hypothetical protein